MVQTLIQQPVTQLVAEETEALFHGISEIHTYPGALIACCLIVCITYLISKRMDRKEKESVLNEELAKKFKKLLK